MQPSPSPCLSLPRNRASAVGDQAQLRLLLILAGTMIFHTTLFNLPPCLLAPSSQPLGSHIPGQRWSRPRHCPGGATLGLCWCQGKRIRSVPRGADVIHERCWRAQSLLCPLGSLSQKAGEKEEKGKGGSCTPTLSLSREGGSSPCPLARISPAFLVLWCCWVLGWTQ